MNILLIWLLGAIVVMLALFGRHFYMDLHSPDEDHIAAYVAISIFWPFSVPICGLIYGMVQLVNIVRKHVNALPGSAASKQAERERSGGNSTGL